MKEINPDSDFASRHPNKLAKWVTEKYLPSISNTRVWVLNDKGYVLSLHSDVTIARYVKVKDNKSPDDGEWTYWSNRIGNIKA